MNEEHDNLAENQTINGIIVDLKLVVDQLGNNFTKTKELIHELARRLDESKLCERDQVSRKIKEILKDKIKEGKITAKWIEDCLSPEYKRKYTTKSEDTSLSSEIGKEIVVDASGNSEIESATTSDADPNNNIVINYEGQPPNVDNLNTDVSLIDDDLEEEIKNLLHLLLRTNNYLNRLSLLSLRPKMKYSSPICSLNLTRILHYTYGSKSWKRAHKMIKKINPLKSNFKFHLKIYACI
jgi:hypothetical protein